MDKNSFNNKIQWTRLSLLSAILVLVFFGLALSCDTEDDTPPPSAYVAPEPEPEPEDCEFETIVLDLADGLDFECGGPETTFFGEKDGSITIEVAENPDTEGINSSKRAMQVVQTAGVEGFAGFFFALATKIDFSEKQTIKIKVYSPAAGQDILIKLEDGEDDSINKEVTATTTVANEWEELSFAFAASDSDKFDKMVLFFNFFGDKDVATTHYYDDITLGEGGDTGGPGGETSEPTNTAPNPNVDETKVISLFSDVYTDVTVDTWRTEWSDATLEDITIEGNAVKKYSELSFVGIETVANQIDATAMTNFHANIWTADATELRIKIVDFGADGAFDGGDDVEHEIIIESPAQEEWVSIDIPLSDFTGLTTRANIAQFIFVATPTKENTVYVDNVYFYDIAGVLTEPASAAPTPTALETDVISMFSDAYTDVPVDTWRTSWSDATLEDITIEGNAVKKYSELNFVGIETVADQIDASEMEFFHTDIWTADATELRIKLVDFGANGAFDGGGDDVEHEITISDPQQNTWVSLDIPLSDFTGLTTKANISQLIYSGQLSGTTTIFMDNIYFYKSAATSTEPSSAAPTPTVPETDVISMFSDAYTDVPVDTWRTGWSDATLEDITVEGNAVKKYSELNFVGIETVADQIDATEMQFFHFDVWTADATELRIKLVDFGANGAFDGGDDVEHEITISAPQQNAWISLDIPLSDFTGLTTRANISQFIYSGQPSGAMTIFVDNVYFSK